MIRAEIAVESSHLPLSAIRHEISLPPSAVRVKGTPGPVLGREVQRNLWVLRLEVKAAHFGSPEGLSRALTTLGTEIADGLGRLSVQGWSVVLSIVQDIEDEEDRLSIGLHLTPAAVDWLSRAGACIDLDQYVRWQQAQSSQ